MIIREVSLTDFGLYRGLHTVRFPEAEAERPVTLIGGLNGRGKTTFLDSITLGLYGRRALRYLQDDRIKYAQYLINHINKSASPARSSVRIVLAEVPGFEGELTVTRGWKLSAKGDVKEQFSVAVDGRVDRYLSENWDYIVEEILPLNISRFFFFDNEKIAQIADDETFESVKSSINALLGLTTIDQLSADLRKYIQTSEAQRVKSVPGEAANKLRENEKQIEAAEAEVAELTRSGDSLRARLAEQKKDYDEEERQFWEKGGNLGLQKDEMTRKRRELSQQLQFLDEQIADNVSASATPLLMCGELLNAAFDTANAQIEAQANAYAPKVIELLQRLLVQQARPESFVDDVQSFLREAAGQLTETRPVMPEEALSPSGRAALAGLIAGLNDRKRESGLLLDRVKLISTELGNIELLLSFEASENDVRGLWNDMQRLTHEMLQNEIALEHQGERIKQLGNQLEALKRRREVLQSEIMSDDQLQDEALRMSRYAAMSERVMERFKKKIQVRRAGLLEDKIYECFSFMAQKSGVIQRIAIDPDTLDIHLIGYNGRELFKGQLSAGEKQLFAVSILWGLAQSSGYDMPVIVDTPLGRLDSKHRENFVGRYLPNAGRQVIVLSTDEEINGRYLELIKPYVNAVYTLVYDDDSHSTIIRGGYFGGESV